MKSCASSQLTLWIGVASWTAAIRGGGPQTPSAWQAFQSATVTGYSLSAKGRTTTLRTGTAVGSLAPCPIIRVPPGTRTIGTQVGQSWNVFSPPAVGGTATGGTTIARSRRGGAAASAGGTIGCRAATLSGAFGVSATTTGGGAGGGPTGLATLCTGAGGCGLAICCDGAGGAALGVFWASSSSRRRCAAAA